MDTPTSRQSLDLINEVVLTVEQEEVKEEQYHHNEFSDLKAIQQQLEAAIQNNLTLAVDAILQNGSLISKATRFWSEQPWWKKVLIGAISSGPLLLVAAFASSALFLGLGASGVVVYIAGSALLTDHHSQSMCLVAPLRKNIQNLSTLLINTMQSLDILRQQLVDEVSNFQTENRVLKESMATLNTQVEILTKQNNQLMDIETKLESTQREFDETRVALNQTIETLTIEHLQASTKAREAYERNELMLQQKIQELHSVRQLLEAEVTRVTGLFQGITRMLLEQSDLDLAQKKIAHDNLMNNLNGSVAGVDLISNKMHALHQELENTKEQLKASHELLAINNQHYSALLAEQAKQLDLLKSMLPNPLQSEAISASPEQFREQDALPRDLNESSVLAVVHSLSFHGK